MALTVLALVASAPAAAQDAGFAVLRLGPDATAMALGDAQTAAAQGAFAPYWNPAGLAVTGPNAVGASTRLWLGDTRAYAASGRFRAGQQGGVGLLVVATDSGDLDARTQPGEAEGVFSFQSLVLGAAYGRRLGPLRAGVTAKYLSQRLFGFDASGYGIDLGLQADLPGGLGTAGVALQHLGEMDALDEEAAELPRTVRGGLHLTPFTVRAADDDAVILDVALLAEASHLLPDSETRVHLGLAATVLELLTARVGYITEEAARDLTFGAGLRYEALQLDYAFVPFDDGFGSPGHVLSLQYMW